MKNLVSVIIPSYNHEKYIKDCIMSVINQTYQNLEILVMDDKSVDNSASIIKSIKDPRLRFFCSKVNRGTVRTVNDLMKKCKGKYIAIIGSDDMWESDKIEKQVAYLEQHNNVKAVFTEAEIIDENGHLYDFDESFNENIFQNANITRGSRMRMFFEHGNHLCHSSSLLSSEIVNKIGLYDITYRQLHDYEYWVRLINEYDIYIINEKLVKYRRFKNNKKNLSNNSSESVIRTINESNAIIKWLFKNIHNDVFVDGFKDLFINKNSHTKDELLCEKYFILLKYEIDGVINKQLAFELIYNYPNKEKIFNVFEKKYKYTLNDFYKDSGKTYDVFNYNHISDENSNCGEYFINSQSVINEQLKIINDYKIKTNMLENDLRLINGSLSFKITKPLRVIKGLIRK